MRADAGIGRFQVRCYCFKGGEVVPYVNSVSIYSMSGRIIKSVPENAISGKTSKSIFEDLTGSKN